MEAEVYANQWSTQVIYFVGVATDTFVKRAGSSNLSYVLNSVCIEYTLQKKDMVASVVDRPLTVEPSTARSSYLY